MKRVLLLSLGLLIGMAGFAQVKFNQGDYAKKSHVTNVKTFDGTEVSPAANYAPSAVLPSVTTTQIRGGEATLMPTMITQYDLQSNSAIGNRIAVWPDGAVAVSATWDGGENGQCERQNAGNNDAFFHEKRSFLCVFGLMMIKIHFFLKKSIVIKLTLAEKQVNFEKKGQKISKKKVLNHQ